MKEEKMVYNKSHHEIRYYLRIHISGERNAVYVKYIIRWFNE